jgi:antitoxin (DNA-binding transcriptional repressor) of toxin-antitoxin stability system
MVRHLPEFKRYLEATMVNKVVSTNASNAVRRFTHYAAMVDAGAEIIISRRGRAPLKLVRAETSITTDNREALVKIALAIRSAKPFKGKFVRSKAYCEQSIRRP